MVKDLFSKIKLKFETLSSEPKPEIIVTKIPVRQLGLATGRVVIVRRAR